MKMVSRYGVLALVVIVLAGNTACTSMQTAYASEEAIAHHKIDEGDKVTLNFTNGSSERIRISSISENEIEGRADDGRMIAASYEELIDIDYKKTEVAKTAGAVVGGAVIGAIYITAVAVGAMAGAQ